jgi:Flp pilus assembly protein TadD
MPHSKLFTSILVAGMLTAAAATASAQMGRIGGIVRDDTGEPVKGATITATNENIGQSLTATTDDKGRFLMIGLRGGVWTFIAQAPGHAPQGGDLLIRMGNVNPPMAFALRRTGPAMFGTLAGVSARDLQADLDQAAALLNQQRWDEAIAAYRAVAARSPALGVVNLQIAAAYRGKKDYAAAIGAYNELLKAEPSNSRARIGISETNAERGDFQAAEDILVQAADGPGREIPYSLAELKLARGDTEEALKWYQRASAADPTWGKPLYKLGLDALQTGDRARAVNYMNRVMAVDPLSPEAASARAALESLK